MMNSRREKQWLLLVAIGKLLFALVLKIQCAVSLGFYFRPDLLEKVAAKTNTHMIFCHFFEKSFSSR